MDWNPIGVAVPFFMLLIAVEAWAARRRGRQVHRLNDSLADLGCGVTEQLLALFTHGFLFAIYSWVWSRWGILELSLASPLTWIVGVVGVDFFYYWYHRFSHRVHFAWAMHVVHHQSEEYNLAVALRQSAFGPLFSWVFYLPLALLGLPPAVWAASVAVSLIYQFWIHTELVNRLGWFEWVFNTPSHHRVHHSINARYIDRNHAGILIVWDRLFGTFEREAEPCTYGSLSPLRSWNPLWANLVPWADLWRASRGLPRRIDRWLLWFRPPEWKPEGAADERAFPPEGFGYDARPVPAVRPYLVAQFVPAAGLLVGLLLFKESIPLWARAVGAMLLLSALFTWSGFLEGRSWAVGLEGVRLLALVICAATVASSGQHVAAAAALGAFSLASAGYLIHHRGRLVGAVAP
jgi:sterol desaturase/sphingolipid hydroxylase (fatty acid hydroxylase superfamily)